MNVGAAYLPSPDDPHPNFGFLSPENSRRARALAVWATLRAYGGAGYREMVERHRALAWHLSIVCFRAHPKGLAEEDLNDFNTRLGDALRGDGRVFAGNTVYAGKVALRPAIVNWLTQTEDVDLLVDVTRELAATIQAADGIR